ncbi:hypothetical protein PRIPAC_75645 [Pristionchus pacificus]|uniref:RING-type domain-containing protein n=1 Tax=Pristionchus pacificus TaxID=54126 RepID=A0A2A6D090_PRIPA|nr:hypothetical protein PRIPAC_75645 [Pristionchus pacificus]|eukprot:PDM83766.1 hypothetical protein PRIPAC_30253 [Pristionchus pacificus]
MDDDIFARPYRGRIVRPSSADDEFGDFICEMRELMDLKEAQPAYDVQECAICAEEFEMEGEMLPMLLPCCYKNMCVKCIKEIRKTPDLFKKGCPYCRQLPFPKVIVDEKCLLKVKERVKEIDLKNTVEPGGIRCATCDRIARKPHHRFVCLTCRFQIGKWLLSGREEDRENIKRGALCTPCSFRHKLWHVKEKKETNEVIPISQLILYTNGQAEDSCEKLLKRIKEKGYIPRSLCIIYSLCKDYTGDEIIDIETVNRLVETTKSVSATVRTLPKCELRTALLADFSTFFQTMATDLIDWAKRIHTDSSAVVEKMITLGVEWAHAVSYLLKNVMEFVTNNCRQVIDEMWTMYLDELFLRYLLALVRKVPVLHPTRIKTILMLYDTCKFIEASWPEPYLAYGTLLKRELVCIRAEANVESDHKLVALQIMYDMKCIEHEKWRREVAQTAANVTHVTQEINKM